MDKENIYISRKFFESEIWKAERVFSELEAWIDILRSVRFSPESTTMDIKGRIITWTCGEWPASLRFLAERWHWSVGRVRNFLASLCKDNTISIHRCNGMNIIHVNGYCKRYCRECFGDEDLIPDDGSTPVPACPVVAAQIAVPEETSRNTPETVNVTLDDTKSETVKHCHKQQEIKDIESETPKWMTSTATRKQNANETENGTKKNKGNNKDNIFINNNITYARARVEDEVYQLSTNERWMNAVRRQFKLTQPQLTQYLDAFAIYCICCGRLDHKDLADAKSHFTNWLRIEIQH